MRNTCGGSDRFPVRCAAQGRLSRLPIPVRTASARSRRTCPPFPCALGTTVPGTTLITGWGHGKFAEMHKIDVRVIVARLSAKPCIRVESGLFVGRFGEEEYALGSTASGLVHAIQRIRQLQRERGTEAA